MGILLSQRGSLRDRDERGCVPLLDRRVMRPSKFICSKLDAVTLGLHFMQAMQPHSMICEDGTPFNF